VRLVLKREISAELARMIAPLMVNVYRWMSPMTASVTKGLKGMEEYVQTSVNAGMASTIAMQTRLATMYRGATTVNVRRDLLETENTVKGQKKLVHKKLLKLLRGQAMLLLK